MSVRELYDALASRYDALIAASGYVGPHWLERMLADLSPPGSVLDLGCANGALGSVVRRRFAHTRMTGMDISAEMIERARAGGVYDVLLVQDINLALSTIPDASVDLVLALGFVEFLDSPRQVLAEVVRVLAPGGTLLASFQEHWPDRPALAPRTIHSGAVAHRAYSVAEVRGLLAAAQGLAVESLESTTGYVTGSGFACPYLMLRATRVARTPA